MTSKGTKKKIKKRCEALERRFGEIYERIPDISERKCFKAREDEIFMITVLEWAEALVLEHADSEEDARKNLFEDGDLFYLEEFDEEQMLKEMIQEIEE